MRKNSKWVLIGIAITIGLVFLGVVISRISSTNQSSQNNTQKITIEDRDSGSIITFHRDGLVEYSDKTDKYSTVWSSEKMSALFLYLENGDFTLGSDYLISLSNGSNAGGSSEDELINTVIGEITGGGSTTPPPNGPIGDLFNTPSPTQSSGGSSGGGGAPSWCKHWRLSYCADHLYPDPTPTPNSNVPGVIQAKDCSEWTSDKKTVISGESCAQYFPTPEPQ